MKFLVYNSEHVSLSLLNYKLSQVIILDKSLSYLI